MQVDKKLKRKILTILSLYKKGELDIPSIQSKLNFFAEAEIEDNERRQLIRRADNQLEEVLFCFEVENQYDKVIEILTTLCAELE